MLRTEATSAFLLAFPALFSILNPLGGAIVFHEVTSEQHQAHRTALARRVAFYSTWVMLAALWAGTYILNFFGISMNALRIAGGIVVAIRAFEMLSAPDNTARRKQREAAPVGEAEPEDLGSYAFFPLTMPFTTGPGTIAVVISLGTARPDKLATAGAFYAGATLACLIMAVLIWFFYSASEWVANVLGQTGQQVVSRLAAFLLLGIGVQIVLTGLVPVLHEALAS